MIRTESPAAAGTPQPKQLWTGTLRTDIRFFPPGEHGNYPLLYDPLSEHYYKMTDRSCRILRMLDRSYPMEEFLAKVNQAGIDADQEELSALLAFLYASCLMAPEYGMMDRRLQMLRAAKEKTFFFRVMSLYLFFRLPPIYPDGFFTATMPLAKVIFNRYTVTLLSLVAAGGYLLMLRQWNEAYTSFVNSLSWANLVSYFWALLATKTIHELSHGYTAKSFGVRVRSMGISFIVFYPRLFVDLTDTWRLSRFKRIVCDGAGIASELIFGGLAAIVWAYSMPGPLRSTMFYLMTVSALGTLLVNGNPFIRYDGYYLLCDILNVENLMSRSSEYLKAVNRRLFFGLGQIPDSGDVSPLTLYGFGLGSFLYRLFLYTSIILIIYFQFTKAVALMLMALEAYTMLLAPLLTETKVVLMSWKKLNWFKTLLTVLLLGALASLLFLPLPWSFTLPCEVVPENSRIVIVRESGFAGAALPEDPRPVRKGEELLPFSNVFLDFSLARYTAAIRTNEAELDLSRSDRITMSQSPVIFEKLRINRISLEEMNRRRKNMSITAEMDGLFIPALKQVSPGRWLDKGTVLGKIISGRNLLYAYAQDKEVNRIKPGDRAVVKLRGELKGIPGTVAAVNPVAVTFRDSTLIQAFGGTVPCYPRPQTKEFQPVNVLYCVTIQPDDPLPPRIGRTGVAYVEQSYRLYIEIKRQLLHVFFREFSF
ncbi:MAG: HlyD family efflux transporter periplasmic adaptor subunit [Lentisphaeria bacterium]|nr:HlyD family efflux transporter periplasmic adaptor subunit [Lentisphaeria bacterium]